MKKIFVLMFVLAVSVFSQKLPTRKQVEDAGKKPYFRYSLASGNLRTSSNSIFAQPAYNTLEGKVHAEAFLRGTAEDLGLAGKAMWNEFGEIAVAVKLEKQAIVVYEIGRDGVVRPFYLADCVVNGKPYFNRLKLIDEPAPRLAPQVVTQAVPPPQQAPAPQIVRQEIERQVPVPILPGNMNVNVSGFPQPPTYPAYPANTTQHIVYEVKRDKAAKYRDITTGTGILGLGVGGAAFGILFPGAYENAAYTNRDGMIGAAKARVPDVMNISASANPTATASPSQSQTGPTVTATGGTGNGGTGGTGNGGNGYGGAGGTSTGGSPSALATATGGPAGSTGPIKIDINNENLNNNPINVKTPPPPPVKPPSNGGGKDHDHNNGNCNGPGNDTCIFK